MKKREKILAGVVLGFVALFVIAFGIKGFFVKPLKNVDKQVAAIRDQINKINEDRRAYFAAEDSLRNVAQRTFATDVNQASSRSGEMITKQIALAGLKDSEFTRLPVNRKFRGGSEIGWSIQGKGTLDKIVNLIFLLQNTPQVHRLESLTLTSSEKAGEIRVRLLYLTLVVEPAPDFDPIELKPKFTLESPERYVYNTILQRDILRPYIKPTPETRKSDRKNTEPSSAPAGPEALKVVSLSEWEGQPEVHIRDINRNETIRYRPGDKLKDNSNTAAEVVAVDYRPLPSPRNPLLLSHSRVILKIGEEFWAVERGQSLAEKRKLQPQEWPVQR